MQDRVEQVWDWCRQHRLAVAVFAITTTLLIVQRLMGWNWDFMVYMMNGEYLLHGGSYIEWYRAPVAALVLGLYRFLLPRTAAGILFVVSVSLLFLYASWKVAEQYDLHFDIFYPLLLSPFVIMQGTFHGTEMLALGFGMMFIADFDRSWSGLWLSLAFLTRYTFVFAVPLVLLQRDVRQVIATYTAAGIPVLAWFGFNWLRLGDPFTSIGNSVALNVIFRLTSQAPDPLHFLLITGLSSLVLAYYLWQEGMPSTRPDARWTVLAGFALLITASYLRTPWKILRYLYPLAFPVAATAAAAWDRTDLPETLILVVVALHLGGGTMLVSTTPTANPAPYERAADDVDGCRTSSNIWPHLSYAGAPAEPVPDIEGVRQQIEDGYRVVVFLNEKSPPFVRNETLLGSLPRVTGNDVYLVLGHADRCLEPEDVDATYLTYREERLAPKGIEKDYRPCRLLFGDICRFIGL